MVPITRLECLENLADTDDFTYLVSYNFYMLLNGWIGRETGIPRKFQVILGLIH